MKLYIITKPVRSFDETKETSSFKVNRTSSDYESLFIHFGYFVSPIPDTEQRSALNNGMDEVPVYSLRLFTVFSIHDTEQRNALNNGMDESSVLGGDICEPV